MRKIITLVALVVIAVALSATQAGGQDAPLKPTPTATPAPKPTYWEKQGCEKKVERKWFVRKLENIYRYDVGGYGGDYTARAKVTGKKRKELARTARCAHSREVTEHRKDKIQAERKTWHFYRYIDRITPFGEWAIPAYIVMCESGGDYTQWNTGGSDASGAYQYLGSTWRGYGGSRYASAAAYAPAWAQHIIANRTYNTTGTSEWMCA